MNDLFPSARPVDGATFPIVERLGLVALAAFLVSAVATARLEGDPGQAAAVVPPAAANQDAPPAGPKKLGILVFPGVQVIDFAGPYEVLAGAHSKGQPLFDVVTVGPTSEMFRAGSIEKGIKMLPDFSIDDCPKLDILVIPGGEVGAIQDNPKAMEWIDLTVRGAECVMSVCNGAFVLAEGGHLKNQSATTFFWFIDDLAEAEPTCTPVYDQRFVDNGKIITTAGLSSGIDGALHLVERYGSRYDAEQEALGLEYNWQPEANWSRANLADRHYVRMVGSGFDFPDGAVTNWTTVENGGTIDRWTKRWTFDCALKRSELLELLDPKMAAAWTKTAREGNQTIWSFDDDKGKPWTATHELESAGENAWTMSIRIEALR